MDTRTYEIHELAKIMPEHSAKEQADLEADIAAHGLRDAITLYEGKILDGRGRNKACDKTGTPKRFETLAAGLDPVAFVLSKNLHRRQLTTSQRAVIALALKDHYAKQAKAEPKTAGSPKAKDRENESGAKAARDLKVSPRTVYRAEAVRKERPDLIPKVQAGEITLAKAKRKADSAKKASVVKDTVVPAQPFLGNNEQFRLAAIKMEDQEWSTRKRKVPPQSVQRFRDYAGKVDAVITGSDQTWEDGHYTLPNSLRNLAETVLKPGGFLVVVTNTEQMYSIKESMGWSGMEYRSTIALVMGDTWMPVVVARANLDDEASDADHEAWEAWKPKPNLIHCDLPKVIDPAQPACTRYMDGLNKLIAQLTKPGDIILDPFMGAGSVGAAALSLGRRFIGFHNDQKAIDRVTSRLMAAIPKEAVPA